MAVNPTAEVRVRTVADKPSIRKAEKDITSALRRVERLSSKGGLLSKSYTQPLGKITGAVGEFEKSLEASNARVIAFGASAGIIYNVTRAIEGMTRAAISLEHKLAEVNVILGASESGLKKFGNELFSIAKNTGQTFDAVAESALEFARQGLAVEETLKRTSDAMILTRLSGLDVQASVEAVTATINSFNQTMITSTQLVNKLANVDAAFAVSAADLAKAVSRVGSSAQDAGVGLDQLIAMVTTAQQVTARGGSVIGNSLKTIFTRLQRPAVISDLEAFGVVVKDATGNTLPAIQTLKNFASAYDSLTPSQRAVSAEMVGGVFQVNVLKAALGDLGKQFSIYDRALGTSVGSTDQAIARNAELNKTLQTLMNESMVNLLKMGAKIGEITLAPAIRSTLEGINDLLGDLESNVEGDKLGAKMGKGILEGVGAILKGPGMIILGALVGKLLFSFTKFSTDAISTFAGMNEGARKQAEMQQLVQNILLKHPELIDAAANSEENLRRISDKVLEAARMRNFALAKSAELAATIAANLSSADLHAMNISTSGGATAGAWRPVAARGFIPNLSKENELAERAGAIRGGYEPGRIKEKTIKGVGRVTYNGAEKVKKFPGMQQEAIIPPQNSDAGKAYEQKFEDRLGFNPYAALGFIPNFGISALDRKSEKYLKGKSWKDANNQDKDIAREMYIDTLNDAMRAKGASMTNVAAMANHKVATAGVFTDWVKQRKQKRGALAKLGPKAENAVARKGGLLNAITKLQANRGKNIEAGGVFEKDIMNYLGIKGKQPQGIPFDFVEKFAIPKTPDVNLLKKKIGMSTKTDVGDAHFSAGHKDPLFIAKYLRYYGMGKQDAEAQRVAEALYPTKNKEGKYVEGTGAKVYDVSKGRGEGRVYTDVVGHGADKVVEGKSTVWGVARDHHAKLKTALLDRRKKDDILSDGKIFTLDYAIDDIDYNKMLKEMSSKAQGFVPNFATKILDKDQLAQAMGLPIGSKEVSNEFAAIVKQAVQRGQISETIIGTAGIGKTTEAIKRAGGKNFVTDPSQLGPGDQLVVVRAAKTVVDTPEISQAGKITYLKGAKDIVHGMRAKRGEEVRRGTSETAFGRSAETKFGSTSGVLTEALLAEKYANKLSVFERQADMSLKEVQGFEKINELKGASATIGAFAPFTVGHQDMMEKGGADVAFVSKGAQREFDVGLSQKEKAKLIELANPNIMAVPGSAGIQQQFEHGGKAYRMKKEDTKVILGADRVAGGEEDLTKGFKSYKGVTAVQGRLDGVSGTKLRKAIIDGNAPVLERNLPPEVFRVIKKNIPTLQKRAAYIQDRKDKAAEGMKILDGEEGAFKAKYGTNKKKNELSEITEARLMFRGKRKELKKRLSGYSGKAWNKLGLKMNFASEGFIPNFKYEGLHEKDFGTTMMGRKGASGMDMSEKQVKKMTAGMRMIRGPEGETLIVGSDMKGRSNRMIVTGLTARKIKKSGAHWRTMLNEVPHLFDGLAYDLVGGVAGAKFDPEGAGAAVAGVKFEQEFAAAHKLPEAGAKKGSDFMVGEKIAKKLQTQKNLQLKLSLHERSKRDKTKVVDIASSFSKYLVDILSHNIKTQGLSSVTTPDRFQQAMGVLNANPAVKKDWVSFFGPMGTKSEGLIPNFGADENKRKERRRNKKRRKKWGGQSDGLIPNFAKYQIGQKLPRGRGAGGKHLAVRDNNMGIYYDPMAKFHADLVEKEKLQGKTMDGGWLFPNGRYEKIPGHDGSGSQAMGFVPSFGSDEDKRKERRRNKKRRSKKWGKQSDGLIPNFAMGLGRGRKKELYGYAEGFVPNFYASEYDAYDQLHKGNEAVANVWDKASWEHEMGGSKELDAEINPERVAASQNQALRAMGVPEYIDTYGTGRVQVPAPGKASFNLRDEGQRQNVREKAKLGKDSRPTFNAVFNEEDARRNVARKKLAIKKQMSGQDFEKKNWQQSDPELAKERKGVTHQEIKNEIHTAGTALSNQYGFWGGAYPNKSIENNYMSGLEGIFRETYPDRNRILITSTKDFVKNKGITNKDIQGGIFDGYNPGRGSNRHRGTGMSHELIAKGNPTLAELESVDFKPLEMRSDGLSQGTGQVNAAFIPETQGEHANYGDRVTNADMIQDYTKKLEDMVIKTLGRNAFSMIKNKKAMEKFTVLRQGNSGQGTKPFAAPMPSAQALKQIGTFAEGRVPNFSRNALRDAVNREKAAGQGQPKVGFDRRLGKSGGIGVYNTTEGSLTNAINMHLSSGKSIGDLQTQGKSDGFLPNFQGGLDSAMMMASMGFLAHSIKDIGTSFKALKGPTEEQAAAQEKLIKAIEKQEKAFNSATQGVSEMEQSITAGQAATGGQADLDLKADDLERKVGPQREAADRGAAAMVDLEQEARNEQGDLNRMGMRRDEATAAMRETQDEVTKLEGPDHGGSMERGNRKKAREAAKKKLKLQEEALAQLEHEIAGQKTLAKMKADESAAQKDIVNDVKAKAKALEEDAAAARKAADAGKAATAKGKKAEADIGGAREKAAEILDEEGEGSLKSRKKQLANQKAAGKMFGEKGRAMQFIDQGGAANIIATAPMLAAQASQFMDKDDLTGKAAVEGAGAAASFAATGAQMGAMLGPAGALVGTLAGATFGIKKFGDGLVKAAIAETGADVKKSLEEVGKALGQVQVSGQKYLETVNRMNSMFKNPADADPEDLAVLQRRMAESLTDIPDKFRAQFIAASGDAEKIKEVFASITEDLQRDKADLEAASKGFDLREKFAATMFDRTIFDAGDSKSKQAQVDATVKSQIRGGGVRQGEVLKQIESGKLDVSKIQDFSDIDSSLLGDDFAAFVNTLEDADDVDEYTRRIRGYFRELEEGSEQAKEAQKVLEGRRAFEESYAAHLKAMNQELANFSATVGIAVDILKKKAVTFDELVRNAQANSLTRAQEVFKGYTQRAGTFQTEESKAKTSGRTRNLTIRSKYIKQMGAETSKAVFRAFEIPLKKFTEASKKTNDLLGKRDVKKMGKANQADFQRQARAQETLLPIVEKSIKILSNSDDKLKDLKGLDKEIRQASIDAGYTAKEATALTENILKQLEGEEENLANKLSLIIQAQDQELVMSAIQVENQLRLIKQQKEMKMLGGAADFAQAGKTTFSSGLDKFADVLGSQLKAVISSDQVDSGRADFQLLKLIRQTMPLLDMADTKKPMGEAAMGLAQNSMVARAKDIQSQMFLAERTMALRVGDKKAEAAFGGVDAYDLAAKQITSELKLETMSEDIAAMKANSEILNNLVGNQAEDLYGANVKAFDAALKANGMDNLPEGQAQQVMATGSLGALNKEGFLANTDGFEALITEQTEDGRLIVNAVKIMQGALNSDLKGYSSAITAAFANQRKTQQNLEVAQAGEKSMSDLNSSMAAIRRRQEELKTVTGATNAERAQAEAAVGTTWTGDEAAKKMGHLNTFWGNDEWEGIMSAISTGEGTAGRLDFGTGEGAAKMDLGGVLGAMTFLRESGRGTGEQQKVMEQIAKKMQEEAQIDPKIFDMMLGYAKTGKRTNFDDEMNKLADAIEADAKSTLPESGDLLGRFSDYADKSTFGVIPIRGKGKKKFTEREAEISNLGASKGSSARSLWGLFFKKHLAGNAKLIAATEQMKNEYTKMGVSWLEARTRVSETAAARGGETFAFDNKLGVPTNLDAVMESQKQTVLQSRSAVDTLAKELDSIGENQKALLERIIKNIDPANRKAIASGGLDPDETKKMLYALTSKSVMTGDRENTGNALKALERTLFASNNLSKDSKEAIKQLIKSLDKETKLKTEGFRYKPGQKPEKPKSPVKLIETSSLNEAVGKLTASINTATQTVDEDFGALHKELVISSTVPETAFLTDAISKARKQVSKAFGQLKAGVLSNPIDRLAEGLVESHQKTKDLREASRPGMVTPQQIREERAKTAEGIKRQRTNFKSLGLKTEAFAGRASEAYKKDEQLQGLVAGRNQQIKLMNDPDTSGEAKKMHTDVVKILNAEILKTLKGNTGLAQILNEQGGPEKYDKSGAVESLKGVFGGNVEFNPEEYFDGLAKVGKNMENLAGVAPEYTITPEQEAAKRNKKAMPKNTRTLLRPTLPRRQPPNALEESADILKKWGKKLVDNWDWEPARKAAAARAMADKERAMVDKAEAKKKKDQADIDAPPTNEKKVTWTRTNPGGIEKSGDAIQTYADSVMNQQRDSEAYAKKLFSASTAFNAARKRFAEIQRGDTVQGPKGLLKGSAAMEQAFKDKQKVIKEQIATYWEDNLAQFDKDEEDVEGHGELSKDEIDEGARRMAQKKSEERYIEIGSQEDDAEFFDKEYENAQSRIKQMQEQAKHGDKELTEWEKAKKIFVDKAQQAEKYKAFVQKLKDMAKNVNNEYQNNIIPDSTKLEAAIRVFADYQAMVARNMRNSEMTNLAKASVGPGFTGQFIEQAQQTASKIAASFVLRTKGKDKARKTVEDFQSKIREGMLQTITDEKKDYLKGLKGGKKKKRKTGRLLNKLINETNGDMTAMLSDARLKGKPALRKFIQDTLAKYSTDNEHSIKGALKQVNFALLTQGFDDMAESFRNGGATFAEVKTKYDQMVEGILDGTGKITGQVKDKMEEYNDMEYDNAMNRVRRGGAMVKKSTWQGTTTNLQKASMYQNLNTAAAQAHIQKPGVRTADENRTFQTQTDINAKNAARGFNDEYKNTLALFKIGKATTEELATALEKMNNAAVDANQFGMSNIVDSLQQGFTYSQKEFYKDVSDMWLNFGKDMRTGTAQAFSEAIKGAKTLKEAFADMFANMADKMLDKSLQMAVDSIFDAVLGKKDGGLVEGYASGGPVRGGSGTKDDVPAYLSRGEYVIKKSAVNAYGQRFFDALNSANVVTAAKGGPTEGGATEGSNVARLENIKRQEIERQRALRDAGIEQFSYREADPTETRDDWLGRDTGQPVINTRTGYRTSDLQGLTPERIEAIRRVAEKYPDVGKNLDKDLFDESTVTMGRGNYKVHLKNKYVYDNLKRPENARLVADSRLSAHALTNENDPQNKYKFEKMEAFFDYQKERMNFLHDQDEQMAQYERQKSARRWGFVFGAASMAISGGLSGGRNFMTGGARQMATGGLNNDNVPALLMGGEYVVRKDIVDRYGTDFFDRLNTGKLSKYATGGLVDKPHTITATPGAKRSTGNTQSGTLGGGDSTTNNINIEVNVDSSGNVTSDTTESNSTTGLTEEESKALAANIKSAVMGEIIEQKRPGGMLYE